MANLKISNLSKSFKSVKVLDDVNLTVDEGEFIVLVGPSGSGKSTILRTIAGLENPDEGTIEINGKVINDLFPKDRDIAMVFQNYALYPHMSVYENISFPLTMKRLSRKEIENSVQEASVLLGINNLLSKRPKELSGGERQRVALGRAIVRKPKLFLMDEPLSNLDAKLRTQMRAELLKLHKTLSSTVVYVTHDQIEALTMGTKIAVLNHGKIQQIGTPLDVYNFPSNLFVAGFIGSPAMNFFNVKIIDDFTVNILGELKKVDKDYPALKSLRTKSLTNDECILGIRPEHLSFSQSNIFSIKGEISLIEILGNEYLFYLISGKEKKLVKFALKTFENYSFKIGEQVSVSLDLSKAHWFDARTGNRIAL